MVCQKWKIGRFFFFFQNDFLMMNEKKISHLYETALEQEPACSFDLV